MTYDPRTVHRSAAAGMTPERAQAILSRASEGTIGVASRHRPDRTAALARLQDGHTVAVSIRSAQGDDRCKATELPDEQAAIVTWLIGQGFIELDVYRKLLRDQWGDRGELMHVLPFRLTGTGSSTLRRWTALKPLPKES